MTVKRKILFFAWKRVHSVLSPVHFTREMMTCYFVCVKIVDDIYGDEIKGSK